MRTLGPLVVVLLFVICSHAAAPTAAHSAVLPESGVLALLGTGLVGLASLVRRLLGR